MNEHLRELYQEVIVDHSRHPRNCQVLPTATHHADGFNTLCGDKLTLYLQVEGDVIKEVSFVGQGCAISTASVSLLTEVLKGKTVAVAMQLFTDFHHAVTTDVDVTADLGKLAVLLGVKTFPARVKCATLAWHTLQAALQGDTTPVSTE